MFILKQFWKLSFLITMQILQSIRCCNQHKQGKNPHVTEISTNLFRI